jgi:hypothetical protein
MYYTPAFGGDPLFEVFGESFTGTAATVGTTDGSATFENDSKNYGWWLLAHFLLGRHVCSSTACTGSIKR